MRFYALNTQPDGDAETEASKEKGWLVGDAAACPACGATVGMLDWLPPFRAELKLFGKQFGDFAFFSGSDYFLASEKFRDIYQHAGLTGLGPFQPVEVLKVKSRRKAIGEPPRYFKVLPNYGETALDLAASGFEWLEQPTCSVCHTATIVRWKRLTVKDGTWTGEDIFRPRGMAGETIVSQRFKDACELHEIKNAIFEPAETSGHDFYPWDPAPKFKASE